MSEASCLVGSMSRTDWAALYRNYHGELRRLAKRLRMLYHRMQADGSIATFGDVEGEVLYMLLRESRPETVFEISPNAGWSTNYILAALTANAHGAVHSFELSRTLQGRPTETVIREHQASEWDQSRLIVHLGDARTTTAEVPGTIDALFLDSCHEAFFARWYLETLFPRVRGPVLIQDIAFVDGLEPSTEAQEVWAWATRERAALELVGAVEASMRGSGERRGLVERRGLRCNSVVLTLPAPPGEPGEAGALPTFGEGAPDRLIRRALSPREGDDPEALIDEAVRALLWSPDRTHRHRGLIDAAIAYRRLGEPQESARCFQRALGLALTADPQSRAKALVELVRPYAAHRQWRLLALALIAGCSEPRSRAQLFRQLARR